MKKQALIAFNEVIQEDDRLFKLIGGADQNWDNWPTDYAALESGSDLSKNMQQGVCKRGELVALACGVLRNLVGVEEIKSSMFEEGAIPRQMVIRRMGGVGALVNVLDPKSMFSSKTREVALRGIMNLCSSSASFVTVLLSYGFVDHVLYFLRYGEGSIQEVALKAAFWLCGTSEESKKAMGDAGVMPELVRFLDSESYEVREMAAETLSSLVVVPGNRKRFVQNDQNVVLLLQMLDPQEARFGNKKLLLSILLPLTSCNTARKKIVNLAT
nr:vacuolar protein 8 [Ipomoea batatas]